MKRLPGLAAIGTAAALWLSAGGIALAQEDDGSVGAAYGLYNGAIEAGDYEAAADYAGRAYTRAVETWGMDNIQTGYLAANYAEMLAQREAYEEAAEIYGKCAEVLAGYLPDTAIDLASCHGARANLLWRAEDKREARAGFQAVIGLIDYAPDDAYMRSLAADAYLMLAVDAVPSTIRLREPDDDESHRFQRTREYVLNGLPYIVAAYGEQSDEVALAYQLIAVYYEFARDWKSSAEYYRRAHRYYYTAYGEMDARTRQMYGRAKYAFGYDESEDKEWVSLAGQETRDAMLDEAAARPDPGEDCFEEKVGNDWVKSCIVRRQPPRYPAVSARKGQFGFAEARYDITEDGDVANISIYTAWPEEVWDEAIVRSMERWRFSPPVDESGAPARLPDRRVWYFFEMAN